MKVAPGVERAFRTPRGSCRRWLNRRKRRVFWKPAPCTASACSCARPSGDPIFAGFRPGVFSLYFGDAPIYHFDREGRWQRAFVAGTHYLKGLDATVQAIDRVREGENLVLKRRTLGHAEASDLDAQVRAAALDVLDALGAGRLTAADAPRTNPGTLRRRAPRRPGAGRRLGCRRLVRAPRAVPRHVRPRSPSSPPTPRARSSSRRLSGTPAASPSAGARRPSMRSARPRNSPRTPEPSAVCSAGGSRSAGPSSWPAATSFARGPRPWKRYLEAIAATFPIDPDSARRRGRNTLDADTSLAGIDAFLDDFTPPTPGWPDWRRLHDRHLRTRQPGGRVGRSGDPRLVPQELARTTSCARSWRT